MDTISRESSSSNLLPIIGIATGALGLILSIMAFTKLSAVQKDVKEAASKTEMETQLSSIQSSVTDAKSSADRASAGINSIRADTQRVVQQIADRILAIENDVTTLKTPPPKASKAGAASKEPVVAGPDEYVIKAGDTIGKIARAHGVAPADVQAVNPNVNPSKLKVGDKIKLPAKK